METRRRNSLRLKGYDYSEVGECFVTICTADRTCILGEVVTGEMRLSGTGKIVESCWRKIPDHFPNTKLGAFQIMPNHVHGIIIIKDRPVGAQHAQTGIGRGEVTSPSTTKGDETSPLRKVALGNVIAYFKYQATKQINAMNENPREQGVSTQLLRPHHPRRHRPFFRWAIHRAQPDHVGTRCRQPSCTANVHRTDQEDSKRRTRPQWLCT